MTNKAFQVRRHLQQVGDACIAFLELGQFRRLLQGVVQRDVQRVGNQLGDFVGFGVRHVERAGGVADDGFGAHGAESDDLADIFASILVGDIVDHLAAAAHGKNQCRYRGRRYARD